MMSSRFSTVIVVACVLVQAACGFELSERYIRLPIKSAAMAQNTIYDNHRLGKSLGLDAESSPALVLDQLKSCTTEQEKCSEGESAIANKLLELADNQDECPSELVNSFVIVYQIHKFQPAENSKAVLNFLEHYGGQKFQLCASKAIEKIKSTMARLFQDFSNVEQFFKLALSFGKDDKISDEFFYKQLKQFEPLKSKFDVDKLVPISRDFGPSAIAAGRINAKFNHICNTVLLNRSELDLLNIAKSLAPEVSYFEADPKLGQQNELYRSCKQAFWNDDLIEHLKTFCQPRHELMTFPAVHKKKKKSWLRSFGNLMKKTLPCTGFSCEQKN